MASGNTSIRSWSADGWRKLQTDHLPGYAPYATAADGQWFDVDAANGAVGFFACLQFIEGEKANQTFVLEPWQSAIVGALFGWKNTDGTRRYREAFIYVARKNGKTPLCAGMVLYGLFVDGEPGAQIYSAAAEREQAALVYRHASGMIARDESLANISKTYRTFKSIEIPATNTIYKALSADADTKHGFSTHLAIVDELHAHPNGDLVDVLQTSMGARREPLLVHITTADYDRESVCNKKHLYASNVRDGVFADPSFLPVIYECSTEDDWTEPEVWAKANPNLGVSIRRDYLERECERAKNEPSYENTFKRLHLNIKTQQDVRWLSMAKWDACDGEPVCEGPCYAGLDLSQTKDATALVLYWPETGAIVPHFWIPSDNAHQREHTDKVPYLTWEREGWITLTPGNRVDYNYIRQCINDIAGQYELKAVGYDPYNATHIAQQLRDEDGLPLVEFRQGYLSMNEPSKYFERLVMGSNLAHGGNPILRWMSGNVTIREDPSGNIKPDKQRSTEKIDGIVACIMAVGLAILSDVEESNIPNFAAY